ncbi:MAG: elongation factor P [Gemmatimonadales bacterium]
MPSFMPIAATNLRRGMAIVFQGEPCRVIEFRHHTPGNLRAMVHAKLRKLRSGVTIEHRFRASDSLDPAELETHNLQFLYRGGDTFHFMNTENFEQLEMDAEALGDAAAWMTDGMQVVAEFYEGRAIAVDLPNALAFEVVETAPVMRTATKTASTKPARLANGVTVNVPEFIATGERVRVNPNTGEYLDRARD